MKFSLATLALIEAAKNGKGGKHGGVNMSTDRFNWKVPKCIQNPDFCVSKNKETSASGSIVVDQSNYKNFENAIFEINVGPNRHISLKFDKAHPFGIEWHNQCGYDKLHLFKGNVATFDEKRRIARFCGPKDGKKPFDGSGKIKPAKGSMKMWDTVYQTFTSQVIVAIDFDQDFDGYSGFKLDWTSEVVTVPDFTDFGTTIEWAQNTVVDHLYFLDWKKSATPVVNSVNKYFEKVNQRFEQPNMKCNKPWEFSVSPETVTQFEDAFDQESGQDAAVFILEAMTKLMGEFVGECKGAKSWAKKKDTLISKMQNNLA